MGRKRDGKEVKIRKSFRIEPQKLLKIEKEFGSFSEGLNEIIAFWEARPGQAGEVIKKLKEEIQKSENSFRKRWGVDLNSKESRLLGEDEHNGGEIFNDEISTSSYIYGLKIAITIIYQTR